MSQSITPENEKVETLPAEHSSTAPLAIKLCCRDTIDRQSAYNPMMVCSGCQQIIKCFNAEKDFRNFTIFCASRRREIQTGNYLNKYIVVFRSYDK